MPLYGMSYEFEPEFCQKSLENEKWQVDQRKQKQYKTEILKQKEAAAKSKAKHDAEVKKLKDFYVKQDEMKKKELFGAGEKRYKTYEEIMVFSSVEK